MYNTNPNLPRVRMVAVRLVNSGMGIRQVARHLGYTHGAVRRWIAKAKHLPSNSSLIRTESSRPHSHPKQLNLETVLAILRYRKKYRRCAQVLHYLLVRDGFDVGLSSVKRTLKRHNCSRYSKWKKWHSYPPKPLPGKPGILVQMDTIQCADRSLYLYTSLDVCSRYAHACVVLHANTHNSIKALREHGNHFRLRSAPCRPITVPNFQNASPRDAFLRELRIGIHESALQLIIAILKGSTAPSRKSACPECRIPWQATEQH
jgi:transposase